VIWVPQNSFISNSVQGLLAFLLNNAHLGTWSTENLIFSTVLSLHIVGKCGRCTRKGLKYPWMAWNACTWSQQDKRLFWYHVPLKSHFPLSSNVKQAELAQQWDKCLCWHCIDSDAQWSRNHNYQRCHLSALSNLPPFC
jgi:hypothetical protein